jgi:hypothetical protein
MATFNSYQVTRNGQSLPYVNSLVEIGYFGDPSSNLSPGDYMWISVPITITTTNGLATVSGTSGLSITTGGIYKLKLSINLIKTNSTANNQNTLFFAFGTSQITSPNPPTGLLGGTGLYGVPYTYCTKNPTRPGILSWTANSMSTGTLASASGFPIVPNRFGSTNNSVTGGYLIYYFYGSTDSVGNSTPAFCSTELLFTISGQSVIYLNVSCDFGTFIIDKSYFTLELISSTYV